MLVVGLGNPGPRYVGTRHNVGFLVVDELWRRAGGDVPWREKLSGQSSSIAIGPERLLLLKPQTLMNRSGQAVQATAGFYRIAPARVLVVHDELDLPLGQLRLKLGGGVAGHNGLRSIVERLGTSDFVRLRFGIGRPPPDFGGDTAQYVLQAFAPPERAVLDELVGNAVEAIQLVVRFGLEAAMNEVNRRSKG